MDWRFVFLPLLFTPFLGAQEPPAEAKRYHDLLLKRPQAGTMFDRFHDAWLEAAPAEELLAFLEKRALAPEAKAADHRLLALLYARRGQDPAALKALEAALKLTPENADTWFEKARMEGRQSDFESALKSLEAAAKAGPGEQLRIDIARQQGRALLRLNRTQEALQTWLNLAKEHPADLDLAEDVTELMAEEGLYAEAAAEAKKLVEQTRAPSEKLARQLRLGDLLLKAEKRDEALEVLEAALGQSGQDSWVEADVLSRLDQVFRREDDLIGLKQRLEKLTKAQAQRVNIGTAYARVLGELGDADGAAGLFRELLARNPGRRDLQEAYLSLLEGLDRIADAAVQAQVLVKQNPEDKELLIRLATLQERQKQMTEAQAALTTYLEKSVVNGVAPENDHLRIARLLETWGQNDAAREAYQKLVAAHPQSVSAQEALAHYLHRSKDDEAALKIWRQLVQKGELEDVLRAGQALQAHGLTREAQDLLMTREAELTEQTRFLALMTQLALANKESDKAVTWSRKRLALTGEASGLQEAVKLAHQAIRDAQAAAKIIAELQGQPVLTIPDRCLLAELLEESGQNAAAEAALQAPQATPAQQVMLGTQRVRLLEQRQEWAAAAEALAGVMQLPGGLTSDRAQQLARLYRRTLNYEKAMAALAEWKKLSPGAVQPWLEESNLLLEQSRQSAALDVLRAASRKFSDDPEVMGTLAAALGQAGKMEEARVAYMALYEQTEDPTTKLRFLPPLAQMSQYAGALPQLLEDFQQRQRQNRASALPWLALGAIHAATGNDEERRRCLYEASRLRPKDLNLLSEIARIEEDNGLYEEALRTLNAAAVLDSTPGTKQKIASLMLSNGDEEAGYRLIFELAGVSTASARAIEKMADTLCEHGQWDRVITLLEPLLPRFPADYRLHYLHAVALEEEGRQAEAIQAFVRLLGMHEELPEVLALPANPNSQQPQSFSLEIQALPPGTAEWMQLPNVSYLAYQHRQKQRGAYQGGWHGGSLQLSTATPTTLPSGWVQQPVNVTNLSAMALYHLMEIGQGMKADDRPNLVKHLESAGIRDSSLLLEVPIYEGRLGIPPDLLEAYPDHLALHALWLLHINQFQGELLPGLKRCAVLFKDSYPTLAFQAGIAAMGLDEAEGDALAVEVLKTASMPEADAGTMNTLMTALQRRKDGTTSRFNLPETLSKPLAAAAKTWSDTLYQQPNSNQRLWSGYSLIMIFSYLEDWQQVAAMVEKENAAHLRMTGPAMQRQYRSSGYFEPQPLQALWKGLDVSPNIIDILQQLARRENVMFNSAVESDGGAEDEKTKTALAKVSAALTTPRLKLMLDCMLQKPEGRTGLVEMMKQPDETADQWLFAASMAQLIQDHELQLACMKEAAARQPEAAIQQSLDNAMLFTAMQLINTGKSPTAEVKPAILDSFERQRATLSSSQGMGQVIEMASALGLTELAEQLKKPAAKRPPVAQTTVSTNPYSRRQNRNQQGTQGKLDKLLAGENEKAVFAEFQQQATRIGETWLGMNWSGADNELQNLRSVLDKRQATGKLIERLKAAPKKGWQNLQHEAAFFELLGHDKTAIEAYEAALALRPRNWEVRARLAVLLARQDVDKGVEHLAAIPRLEMRMVLQRLAQEASPRSYAGRVIEHRLAVIRLLTSYVEKHLDPKRRMDPSLVGQFAQIPNYIQQGEYGDASFPGLYETEPSHTSLSDAAKEARAQLRKAHDDFCLALTKVPMLAQSGFGPYAGLAAKDGQPLEKLEELAREVLNRQVLARRYAPNIGYWFSHSYSRHGLNNQITMPQADDVLLRILVARGETEKIETELLPLIKKSSGVTAEKQMRAYARLHTCTEAEFLPAAREWSLSLASNGQPGSGQEITRIWAQRAFTLPIHDIYLDRLKDRNSQIQTQELSGYLSILAKAGKTHEAEDFLKKVRDVWLGNDAEKRKTALAGLLQMQNSSRRYYGMYSQNSSAVRWQNYLSLLSDTVGRGPAAIGLRAAREDGLLEEPSLFSQICSNLFDDSLLHGPTADLIAVLEELRLLAPAEDLRLWFNQRGRSYTALQMFTGRIDNSSPEMQKARDQLILELRKRQPQTFGSDLILLLLTHESRNGEQAFRDFLKQRGKEFPRLSAAAKLELSAFIKMHGNNFRRQWNEEVAELLEPLAQAEQADSIEMAERVLQATTWEQARMEEYNNEDHLTQMIQNVAAKDREKAVRLLRHCLVLLKQTPAQIQANTPEGGPVYDLLVQMGRVPSLMNEVIALAEKEQLKSEWRSRFTYAMEEDNALTRPAHVLAMFQDSPFVAEAEKFQGLTIPGRSEGSALVRMCGILRSNDYKKAAEALTKDLQSRSPKTFGVRLTLALLDPATPAVENFLLSETESLTRLPPAEASGLLVALGYRASKFRTPHLLPEELQKAMAPLFKAQAADDKAVLEAFLDAPALSSNGSSSDESAELARKLRRHARVHPREGQQIFEKLTLLFAAASRNQSGSSPAYTPLAYWLGQCTGIPEIFTPAMQRAESEGLLLEDNWMGNLLSHLNSDQQLQDAATLTAFLKSAPFQAEAKDFRAYPVSGRQEGSLLDFFVSRAQRNKKVTETVREHLQDGPPTFGHELVSCLLHEQPRPALADFLKKRQDDLAGMSPESRNAFDLLLESELRPLIAYARELPVLAPLLERQKQKAEDTRKTLLTLNHDQAVQSRSGNNLLATDLALVAQHDPKAAREVFAQIVKVIQLTEPATRRQANPNYSKMGTFLGSLKLDPGLWPLISEEARLKDLLRHPEWLSTASCTNYFQGHENDEIYIQDALVRSGLLNEAGSFDPLQGLGGPAHTSLLHYLSDQMAQVSLRKGLTKCLNSQKTPTFGVALFKAIVANNRDQALNEFAAQHATGLAQMPPETQALIVAALESHWPSLKSADKMPEEVQKVLRPLLEARRKVEDSFMNQVLEAKEFSELGLPENGFASQCKTLIRKLVIGKKEAEASQVFEKAALLMEEQQKKEGWNRYPSAHGWTIRSAFLFDCANGGDMALMAFAIKTLNADRSGRLTHSGWIHDYGWGAFLHSRWQTAGGRAAPAASLQVVMAELKALLKDEPTALLAIAFQSWITRLGHSDIRAFLQWTEKLPKDHDCQALAQELQVVARLYLEAHPEGVGPQGTCAIRGHAAHAPLWQHYQNMVTDKKINPLVRVAVGSHLCTTYPWAIPAGVLMPLAKLAATENLELHAVRTTSLAPVVRCFGRLPVTEEWRATADLLWQGWMKRLSPQDMQSNRGNWYAASFDISFAMLQLAGRLKNDAWIDTLLNVHAQGLKQNRSIVAVLTYAGYPEKAAALLAENQARMYAWQSGIYTWHPDMLKELPAFQKACKDPGLALLGEMIILQASDPQPALLRAFKNKEGLHERIGKLAPKILKTPFSDEALRMQAVSIVANYAPRSALEVLSDYCAGQAPQIHIHSLTTMQDSGERAMKEYILAVHFVKQALTGKPEAWIQAIETLSKNESGDSYTIRSTLTDLINYPAEAMAALWERGEGRDPKLWLPVFEKILALEHPSPARHTGIAASYAYVLATQTEGGLEAWEKKLSPAQRRAAEQGLAQTNQVADVAAVFAGEPGSPTRLSDNARLKMVLDLLTNARLSSTPNILWRLKNNHRLLTLQEMLDKAEVIHKTGRPIWQKTYQIVEAAVDEGHAEKAGPVFDLMLDKPNLSKGDKTAILLRKAAWLIRTGKKTKAAETLDELDKDQAASEVAALRKLIETAQ